MHRIPLLLVVCAIAGASAAQTIRTRLDLVAEHQTTSPLIYEGAYDVYELVAIDPLSEANAFTLDLQGLHLVETEYAGGIVRASPELDMLGAFEIPASFFVLGDMSVALDATSHDLVRTDSSLSGMVVRLGNPLFPPPPRPNQVLAVLTVPSGAATPGFEGSIGEAYTPIMGPVSAGAPVPGDLNQDGNVDVIDLDFTTPIFPQPPQTFPPDINGDGERTYEDTSVLAGNFGLSAGVTEAAIDAIATPIVFLTDAELCPTDPNHDCRIDILDLDILSAHFGTMGGATIETGDFNGDGAVDILDLDILAGNFSSSPPATTIPEPPAAMLALGTLATLSVRKR